MAPFEAISGQCVHGPPHSTKNHKKVIYFPWWSDGPYSHGLGLCAGVRLERICLMLGREGKAVKWNCSGWLGHLSKRPLFFNNLFTIASPKVDSHGRAAKERHCTVPVYLRRGSILVESQHPTHKKTILGWNVSNIMLGIICTHLECFLNGRI